MDPNQQGKYTAAVALFVFHWIPKLEATLRNVYRVMAPKGKLLVLQAFNLSDSYFGSLPNLTSNIKWKTILDKVYLLTSVPQLLFSNYYSCGFSTATIEYSCLSVCVSVCLSVYMITKKIMVQLT